ncbi:hypothetical protein BH11BAC1_BH11BAC1_02510 [soil metagenome]
MKKIFLSVIFIAFVSCVEAQNTWVQKLSYNWTTWGYGDTLTGIKQIEVSTDGSLFILANIACQNSQKIFKFSPQSHTLEWDIDGGHNGNSISNWTDHIQATADSGIIVCQNILDESMYSIWSTVAKYSKNGSLEWSHQFGYYNTAFNHTLYDAFENSYGGYYVLVEDSMFTLDNLGNIIDSTNAIAGRKFLQMTNGNFLLLTANNQLVRTDTAGNIIWSHACSGVFAYDTASVYILNSNSYVQKVDALNGLQIWNRNYGNAPVSEIEATHDGGFIASVGYKPHGPYSWGGTSSPGILFRADSLGDTLWTRTYQLPHFGLPTIKIMPNGNLSTGGCYLSGHSLQGGSPNEYSAFWCMMNYDGSYPLQQTSYVGPQDANHDHIADYVDDALEVMLGIGQTGPSRDTTLYGYPNACERDDIAIDWTHYTNNGVNRKYSDYDGSGVIDTNDILLCNSCCYFDSLSSLYRYQNPVIAQNAEEFCLVPVRDTIALGDSALFYMVMGNAANPVDSIYGFAFTYNIDPVGNDRADSVFSFNTNFGTQGSDLFLNHRFVVSMNNGQEYRSRTLICRTNFQNAYGVNDTIGIVRFVLIPYPHTVTPTIRRFKAILADGSEIPFNTCTGTVIIDSSSVSVDEKQNIELSIFPNPASDYLSVKNAIPGNKKITVLNSLGMIVKEFESAESQLQLSVEDLPNGIFNLSIQSDKRVNNTLFVVQH